MNDNVTSIFHNFPVRDTEYQELENKFGKLCHFANWELKRKNTKNHLTDEHDDIAQELRIKLITAGSYYKRQVYIEDCLVVADIFAKGFMKRVVQELWDLWLNRTRHGANRVKFGEYQERILERIVKKVVPRSDRPRRDAELRIDTKFTTYCKAIIWNGQKTMGKKITKEKAIRTGLCSLSDYDYLAYE